jgi:FKBP-type peptidyl-prolyl cis-trans isomerase FkpA
MKHLLLLSLMAATLVLSACTRGGSSGDDDDDSAGDDDDAAADWVETDSGLMYLDVLVGDGDVAAPGDTVSAHYTGWLYEDGVRGEQFDSSRNGNPFSFTLGAGQVIAGWDEGIEGMAAGGQRTLIIPPELGYGANGYPGVIPGNATLEFEVELMGLN